MTRREDSHSPFDFHLCASTVTMGKVTYDDKLRIQALYEQGYEAKRIKQAYPERQWCLSTIAAICRRISRRGSATDKPVGSGRPKTARTAVNIAAVEELFILMKINRDQVIAHVK